MNDQIRAFCAQQKEWLQAELVAGQRQTTDDDDDQRATRVLSGLELASVSVGLYGRTVLELCSSNTTTATRLPAHKLTPGDEVELRSAATGSMTATTTTGVVSVVTDTSISIALGKGDLGQPSSNKTTENKKNKRNHSDSNTTTDDDDEQPYGPPPYTLVPTASVEVHRKMVAALDTLAQKGVDHPIAGPIVRALFEAVEDHHAVSLQPRISDAIDTGSATTTYMEHLDDSQREAIDFCLSSTSTTSAQPSSPSDTRLVSLIHGPPGTGKTTTLTALIRRAVHQYGWRVLVTAPSNVAVDNILAKLVASENSTKSTAKQQSTKSRLRVVRLGHPARLQAAILPYSLEAQVQSADGTELVADVRRELQHYLQIASYSKQAKPSKHSPAVRATARREIRALRAELRQREQDVVRDILQRAHVVLATTVGAAAKILNNAAEEPFDLVVIDEAAQALEASCWIPILQGKRLVLAGDHCQLPPTIQSSDPAVVQGLGRTLFERTLHLYGDAELSNDQTSMDETVSNTIENKSQGKVSRMLKVQYRMNQRIADWASRALYGGQLQTHESVAQQTLAGMVKLSDEGDDDDLKTPLLLIDTAGCALHEQTNAAGSRFNEGEAQIVRRHLVKLIERGVTPPQIAVITPYNGQVELLRNLLLPDYPTLEIRSVDGFQGGERPVVVLSLVRSSARGGMDGIGFLKDDRRLNVAVTRAQRHCCVVADSETVSQSSFVKVLLEWIEEHGDTRSALEYTDDSNEIHMNSDLAAAELEIARIMSAQETKPRGSKKSTSAKVPAKSSKESAERHAKLNKMVEDFAKANLSGSELRLSAELTSRDRRLVHELAERLGIQHQSEGREGLDRRITLCIPPEENDSDNFAKDDTEEADVVGIPATGDVKDEKDAAAADSETDVHKPSTFEVLVESDSDKDEGANEESSPSREVITASTNISSQNTSMNNVLGNLAQERARRDRQKQIASAAKKLVSQANPTKSMPKPIVPKKQGKRLGGASKPRVATAKVNIDDDLDDMAFLDAQIEQVQNSHGRRVEGKGNYKSIVNGILLAKPAGTREPPKNTKASAALQSKLKQVQDGRKAKPKKKKR